MRCLPLVDDSVCGKEYSDFLICKKDRVYSFISEYETIIYIFLLRIFIYSTKSEIGKQMFLKRKI